VAISPPKSCEHPLSPGTGSFLISLNGATGEERWRTPIDFSQLTAPVVGFDGTIYFAERHGSGTGSLLAIDPESGERLWASPPRTDIGGRIVIGEDGTLFAGTTAIDWATGKIKWRLNLDVQSAQLVLGSDQTLYISSGDFVYAVDSTAGALKWSRDLGEQNTLGYGRSMAVTDDQVLYVQTHEGILMLGAANGETLGDIPYGFENSQSFSDVSLTLTKDRVLYAKGHNRVVAFSVSSGPSELGWPMDGLHSRRTYSRERRGAPAIVSISPHQPLLEGSFATLAVLAAGDRRERSRNLTMPPCSDLLIFQAS
jgi:outer membrane protein assembly factor BamB